MWDKIPFKHFSLYLPANKHEWRSSNVILLNLECCRTRTPACCWTVDIKIWEWNQTRGALLHQKSKGGKNGLNCWYFKVFVTNSTDAHTTQLLKKDCLSSRKKVQMDILHWHWKTFFVFTCSWTHALSEWATFSEPKGSKTGWFNLWNIWTEQTQTALFCIGWEKKNDTFLTC